MGVDLALLDLWKSPARTSASAAMHSMAAATVVLPGGLRPTAEFGRPPRKNSLKLPS